MALVALLILAWALRFDYIRPAGTSSAFYKVNRWTGTTYLCHPSGCREVPDR